jgi:hypothetical protein
MVKSEVARENKEASNASLRDLDSAFGQSSKVATSIIKQGVNALDAVQEVKNPLSLLT